MVMTRIRLVFNKRTHEVENGCSRRRHRPGSVSGAFRSRSHARTYVVLIARYHTNPAKYCSKHPTTLQKNQGYTFTTMVRTNTDTKTHRLVLKMNLWRGPLTSNACSLALMVRSRYTSGINLVYSIGSDRGLINAALSTPRTAMAYTEKLHQIRCH